MIIKSCKELRNKYNDIAKLAYERQEPIYITRNGRGDLIIMGIEALNVGNKKIKDKINEKI